jgi:CPA2 family monovalent cation:H+ antiporter-2
MVEQPLTQVLVFLAASVFVVALARRLGWPSILGYLIVGMTLGPHAVAVISESETSRLLSELGVVFLLFTLGLEFSLPRMMAVRREVFGLGAIQVVATASVFALIARFLGGPWLVSVVVGGACAMSSTAIILHQLTDQDELNRTHGRLAFSILLFQDLAFVPFLSLASIVARGTPFTFQDGLVTALGGSMAVVVVLAAGRWLLRPLFHEIANSRLRELFTMAVLLVVLASAWTSYIAGLSLALGAFLAGMMLAETEYRYQIDAVIRPFRDILLGLFFISVGMLLDVRLLFEDFALIAAMLLVFLTIKALVASLAARTFVETKFKAVRTGVVMSIGGEFGIALLTLVLQGRSMPADIGQPLLVAVVLSMVLSPLIIRNNRAITRFVLREKGPPRAIELDRDDGVPGGIAEREHVILCGYGRVGQNIARVLEQQGFEYVALDIDPARIRGARQAGEPVIFGDSSDEEMLIQAGLANASAVIVSFSNPGTAIGIVRSVRALRADVPVLVRTQDDARMQELKSAGATEVVPETFEASLMLVSQVLMLLKVPTSRVVRMIGEIRNNRYSVLRSQFHDSPETDAAGGFLEELRSIVLPPGAWSVGRTLDEVRDRGAEVAFTGIRRQGILGRSPSGDTMLREGDIVVIYGLPDALERAEALLLAG